MAAKPRPAIGALGLPGLVASRRVVADPQVVEHAARARTDLHRGEPALLLHRHVQREDAVEVRPVGRDLEAAGHLQHQVGRAELPVVGERRQLGELARIPLGRALLGPGPDGRDLAGLEVARPDEVAVALDGRPGRHQPCPGDQRQHARALARVGVGDQREGRRLPGTVALGAVLEEDRRDVAREGDLVLGPPGRERRAPMPPGVSSPSLPAVACRDTPGRVGSGPRAVHAILHPLAARRNPRPGHSPAIRRVCDTVQVFDHHEITIVALAVPASQERLTPRRACRSGLPCSRT